LVWPLVAKRSPAGTAGFGQKLAARAPRGGRAGRARFAFSPFLRPGPGAGDHGRGVKKKNLWRPKLHPHCGRFRFGAFPFGLWLAGKGTTPAQTGQPVARALEAGRAGPPVWGPHFFSGGRWGKLKGGPARGHFLPSGAFQGCRLADFFAGAPRFRLLQRLPGWGAGPIDSPGRGERAKPGKLLGFPLGRARQAFLSSRPRPKASHLLVRGDRSPEGRLNRGAGPPAGARAKGQGGPKRQGWKWQGTAHEQKSEGFCPGERENRGRKKKKGHWGRAAQRRRELTGGGDAARSPPGGQRGGLCWRQAANRFCRKPFGRGPRAGGTFLKAKKPAQPDFLSRRFLPGLCFSKWGPKWG